MRSARSALEPARHVGDEVDVAGVVGEADATTGADLDDDEVRGCVAEPEVEVGRVGLGSPAGHTVTKVPALGATAVTFSTTADTPFAGTPPTPVTVRS